MAVGNDSDGVAKLWITSKLFASTITVPLGLNLSISSAYNEQSSRSRELLVESSYTSTTTSLHHVFVPLENGVLNVTFMYNGSAAQDNETITVVQPHKLYRFGNPCPHMCASLGVYRIRGSLYYTLCAGSSGICRCQLSQRNQQQHIAIILLSNCRLLSYLINTDIIVQRISDVLSFTPIRTQSHLLFTLNKYIYQDDLVDGTYVNPIPFSVSLNCQVVLRIQITVNSKLLIYCANNTMVEYDFNTDYRSQFNNHLYFPCSETAKFLVNLTNNENADVHYFRMDDIPQRFPRQVRRFKLGECIEYEGHHLFLFTDWDNNLHLINSSMLTLYNISPSNQFARPLITGERYVVTYNPDNQTMSAFDLEDISSPIIIQQDIMPFQLATVISNLSMIVEIEPTPSSMVTFSPTSPYSILAPSISVTILVTDTMATSPEIEQELVIWPPIAIALAVIIVLCSGVVGTIGFIIYCYR